MKNFFKGFVIGIGKIIPGVSGAMLAITLGIYDKAIDTINNFKKKPKENTKFLFPIVFGIILGIIIFSKIIDFSLTKFYVGTMLFFIGLVIGGMPSIIKETNKKDTFLVIIVFVVFLLISLLNINNNYVVKGNPIDYLIFFLSGLIEAIGTVVPGISSTAMLMIMGTYKVIISSLGNILNINIFVANLKILIPFTIGFTLGLVLTVKIIAYALKKYKAKVYSFILGILSSSIVLLIIKAFKYKVNTLELIISLVLLIAGIIISNKLEEK